MQENETPIEDETTDIPTTEPPVEQSETIGFIDTNPDAGQQIADFVAAASGAVGLPVDVITGVDTPLPIPTPGRYDVIYNPEAHSRRSANTRHKAKKVERLFTRGEQMMIKGTLFKVTAVGHKTMTLQLLPQPKETETSD